MTRPSFHSIAHLTAVAASATTTATDSALVTPSTPSLSRRTIAIRMGDPACYLEYCPECETPVPAVEGECPDCGAATDGAT